jgi:cytosine/adenosine deaminase-related metal-dependent hydrolase
MAVAHHAVDALTSIHLGESPEEVHFLNHGGGPIQAALQALGAWDPRWTPPRCGPVEYLGKFGLLSERLLAVHGVQLSDRELAQLAAAGATLVTCPRSNHWVGAGDPPVARFYESGVRVAVGTDSLASVQDLNVFAEMAAIRRLSSEVPARAILESATRIGAEALGFWRRIRHDRAREAGGVAGRASAGRCRGCGRIFGRRNYSGPADLAGIGER